MQVLLVEAHKSLLNEVVDFLSDWLLPAGQGANDSGCDDRLRLADKGFPVPRFARVEARSERLREIVIAARWERFL